MPSIISAGTTANTGLNLTADTSGNLVFQTNGNTTAMTIDTSQNVTYANGVSFTGVIGGNGANISSMNASNLTSGTVASARLPSITSISNGTSNVAIASSNGNVAVATNGTTAMTIDTSQNVGVGTTSPTQRLTVAGSTSLGTAASSGNTSIFQAPGSLYLTLNTNGTLGGSRRNWAISPEYDVAGALSFTVGASEGASPSSTQAIITSGGDFRFNSGYGSVATAYGCRAWVSWDGTNGSIRGSGNVSSVTRNSTGQYTVNMTTAMPDANYSVPISTSSGGSASSSMYAYVDDNTAVRTTTTFRVTSLINNGSTFFDSAYLNVAVFR